MVELDLSSSLIQAIGVVLAVTVLTLIALLKFYVNITSAQYRNRDKMEGKTVIITGGNGGIGKETAKEIAKRGARIILACRNLDTANKIKEELIETTNNQHIIVKKLDLSSFDSIRAFAEDINNTEPRLDVLLHNAGCAFSKVEKSKNDIEMTMATNHFGPFLLTHLLIDLLKKSAPSRIVVVASELYRVASLDLGKLNVDSSWFPPYLYYVSKYANICFTNELSKRLEGSGVTANSLHPGLVDTAIWDSAPMLLRWPLKLITKGFFKSPEKGCQTSVYVACSEELEGVSGKYYMECKEHGLNRGASDMDKAKKLWEITETLVGLKPSDKKI